MVQDRCLALAVPPAARGGFDAGTIDVAEGGAAVAVWEAPGSDVDPEEVEAVWITHFQTYCDPARLP